MVYPQWHQQTIKSVKAITEKQLYFNSLIFGLASFFLIYSYELFAQVRNPLNKSVADVSIFLIGLSMLLSSVCYFWNFLDTKIVYRKHLGLIGFAFSLAHIGLSLPALKRLFELQTWQQNAMWPMLTGALAAAIFTIMALISNRYAATQLGGQLWRAILRTGYIGIILVWIHVILLKSNNWLRWFNEGLTSLPAMSLLVSIFMTVVIVMRIALWWSLRRHSKS